LQIVYVDKDTEDSVRDAYSGWIVDALPEDLLQVREVCHANVIAERAMRAAKAATKAARLEANRATANNAMSVAAGAPRRNWDVPNMPQQPPARTPSPSPARRRFNKTIASPGRLPTESDDVVFQGVRSPHIFMVQDNSDSENEEGPTFLTGGDSLPAVPARIELQARGLPHVHHII
jgi:hypothetical protein